MDKIIIIDFGGQYTHLIGRKVREKGVYSEIVPYDMKIEEIDSNVKGIILSGGPYHVSEDSPKIDPRILDLGIPILGICYGHQLIAYMSGGKVGPSKKKEYGITYVNIINNNDILKGLSKKEKVWMSHSDSVFSLPDDYEVLAYSENCPIAAFKHKYKPIYGVQWHPEVYHTENGDVIFENFISICNCNRDWKIENLLDKMIEEVRNEVKNGKAIIALSGGIDSSTAAMIAAKAIGNRLVAVFVDHGFMREGEVESIKNTFKELNLIVIEAKDRFLEKIKGVSDPELKRKLIGEEFIRVFEEIAEKVGAEYLIQGTIYPDRIESGLRHSDKIKSHHNVAGIPSKIKFKKIIEPLRDLYKDEVRKIALKLGLPKEIVYRQPFPGPGLAVRIIGEVTKEKLEIIRKADKIVREEIEKSKIREKLWQYFAVLTDTKTTGVKGDERAYGYVVAIRCVESREAMTARFANIPYKLLERISTRITNEIPQVVRVVYDITHKPPATIEWE
ncbi:MAG: GMP synthase (glutamine-hydrolyzing) [Candidatus Methanomethylicota archaeon]|jgi:GMP synthase (glutamine-hydrolysing)|uniref:GMP synthase [glutamine-hydrolyzing] n=1 Tax=Thermoproteota archaeon TaxID=2056631 RepID=A0A520KFZ3_9CREN|nr:MAG: glutamine-hydrolyzing GMP synthase [Candidatus Verstraetearchaeota archaeon]TDA38714.1 MAG: GMP synthase (glutamine-hydrolyzing) [Candidatus Verstraetearchaeota archaeon]